MFRITLLLLILLINNPRIATAQSTTAREQTSCNRTLANSNTNNEINKTIVRASTDRAKLDRVNASSRVSENNSDSEIVKNTLDIDSTEKNTGEKPKIAVAGIPIPSLWWAKEQFDPFGGRLINEWLTYPQIKQIDLTVNWQLWTLLDYLGRYRFINQFGTVAREYGYSLRIFNQQQKCLAYYEYNDDVNPPKWEINIEGLGQDSLQVEPSNGQ